MESVPVEHKDLIYGLKDPRTGAIRYVGKSKVGMKRPLSHRVRCRDIRNKTHIANWVRELQALGLDYEIVVLEYLPNDTAFREAEPRWIAKLRAEGCDLTNATIGGEGVIGRRHTEESKKKMSLARKGRPFSEAHKQALSKARQGIKLNLSDDRRRQISDSKKGNKYRLGAVVPEEMRARISAKLTGRKMPEEEKIKQRLTHAKRAKPFIDQYGTIYSSIKDAIRRIGVDPSSLLRVLKGRLKSTKGYKFTYLAAQTQLQSNEVATSEGVAS